MALANEKNKVVVGVSGEPGCFSEEAANVYAKQKQLNPTISYLLNMEGVLAALTAGKIDIGIFPVVNLHGGLVQDAFIAMGRYLFKVIDEVWLEVNQCLLVKDKVVQQQIKKIVSHPQAIAQTKLFLQKNFPRAEIIAGEDTAKAARDLVQGTLSAETAVIAPERAATLYGLKVLASNIQDHHPNLTAFIVVKK